MNMKNPPRDEDIHPETVADLDRRFREVLREHNEQETLQDRVERSFEDWDEPEDFYEFG